MIKSTFTGHLGADAETFETSNGQFVSFRVATNDYDKKTQQEVTTWIRVTASQRVVGNLKLLKGSHVFITGSLKVQSYQTKTGETAFSIEVFADSINYVGGGKSTGTATDEKVGTGTFTKQHVPEPMPAVGPSSASTTKVEDDLPF